MSVEDIANLAPIEALKKEANTRRKKSCNNMSRTYFSNDEYLKKMDGRVWKYLI
jgi:hypothetical protein